MAAALVASVAGHQVDQVKTDPAGNGKGIVVGLYTVDDLGDAVLYPYRMVGPQGVPAFFKQLQGIAGVGVEADLLKMDHLSVALYKAVVQRRAGVEVRLGHLGDIIRHGADSRGDQQCMLIHKAGVHFSINVCDGLRRSGLRHGMDHDQLFSVNGAQIVCFKGAGEEVLDLL